MKRFLLIHLCYAALVLSSSDQHNTRRVVIVGAGAAGIAAASKLLENGFTDVTILEAENRIGGRIQSVEFGDYFVDLGAQWVDGENGNVAFELAWPLGLLEKPNSTYEWSVTIFASSGASLSDDISYELDDFAYSFGEEMKQSDIDKLTTGSFGEYADAKLDEYMKSHPEINPDFHDALRRAMDLRRMVSDGADSWHDISAKSILSYADCEGDSGINWKNRTWSTILDILIKKIPNPAEELPVLRNTHLAHEVKRIDYSDGTGPIKVTTANGKEFIADHVIFTASLGVLKATHVNLFNPPLPPKKMTSIKNIDFGHGAKIIVYNENPWWHHEGNELNQKIIFWTNEDRIRIENDPMKKWMLGINTIMPIEHKPKLLSIWVASNYSVEMESVPDDIFRDQVSEFIHKFFGNEYNITEPTEMRRSFWNTNKNFRGIYSYRGIKSDVTNVGNEDLAQPIMYNDKPIIQFAGEATTAHYGSVNGAIESGWREANRLINFFLKSRTTIITY